MSESPLLPPIDFFLFCANWFTFRLENIVGDWHEFESKALRKEKDKERRAEYQRDKEKRKASLLVPASEREMKRVRPEDPSVMP